MGGDVGDVDPEPDPVPVRRSGDGVVEVARGLGVDGEGVERGQVAALGLDRLRVVDRIRCGVLDRVLEAALAEALPDHRRGDVCGAFGVADLSDHRSAVGVALGDDQLTPADPDAAADPDLRGAALEQGLRNQEAAATPDHRLDRDREPVVAGREAAGAG